MRERRPTVQFTANQQPKKADRNVKRQPSERRGAGYKLSAEEQDLEDQETGKKGQASKKPWSQEEDEMVSRLVSSAKSAPYSCPVCALCSNPFSAPEARPWAEAAAPATCILLTMPACAGADSFTSRPTPALRDLDRDPKRALTLWRKGANRKSRRLTVGCPCFPTG